MGRYFNMLAAYCFAAALFPATTGSAQSYSAVHVFSSATGIYAPLTQGPDGTFYGTSSTGGATGFGTVFKVQPDGTGYGIVYSFTGLNDGSGPVAGLVLSGNTLYGAAEKGGNGGHGTVFKVNTDGSGFARIHGFSASVTGTNTDGAHPEAGLVLAGSTLYGTTYGYPGEGTGQSEYGTVFRVNTDGTGFTNLFNFAGTNGYPQGELLLSGSTLYGTTPGLVFKIQTDGTGFANVHRFSVTVSGTNSDGTLLYAGVILSGSTLYGTASGGGTKTGGTVFRVNTDSSGFTNLYNFGGYSSLNGGEPRGGLVLSGGTLYGTTSTGGTNTYGTVFRINTDGTGYTNLYSFQGLGGNDGATPWAGLVLSGDMLYGTTAGYGDVFKIRTNGTGYELIAKEGSEGAQPRASLVLSGSTLYGTTMGGGLSGAGNGVIYNGTLSGSGTVFRVNTNGTSFATLYNFSPLTNVPSANPTNSDGATPKAGLVLAGSTLYGTASEGGRGGYGTIFSVNTDGTGFTTLHSFTNGTDGSYPLAGLVLAGSTLYGTASGGGGGHAGTVFQINTNGTGFALVHTFPLATYVGGTQVPEVTNADGAYPSASLLLVGDTLYGTTAQGGPLGGGTLFKVNTNRTGFTNFYNFIAVPDSGGTNAPNGAYPAARLILSGNILYGTAAGGGIGTGSKVGFTYGTVFKVNTDGTGFVRLYEFTGGSDASTPAAGLTLSGSTLYGTAAGPQIPDDGALFQVSTDGLNFRTLHTFSVQGGTPTSDLLLVGNTLYGTSEYSAVDSGLGTVFAVVPAFVPSVQFTASPSNGLPPLTVQFSAPAFDSGNNPISFWRWDFGDGSTNATQNPVHTYTNNGTYFPTLIVTNNNGATVIGSGPSVDVEYSTSILNAGFEAGTFTNWTVSGTAGRSVTTGATYAHSGTYGARLAASGSLGFLSQTISTTPGKVYSISFWLDSPTLSTPNEFEVLWNGNVLMDITNVAKTGWTNIQFLVTATGATAVLQFGYRNDLSYFGLDDISVGLAQPSIAGISLSGRNLVVNGLGGLVGRAYYVLTSTNITEPLNQWARVATYVAVADGIFSLIVTNAVDPSTPRRFYAFDMIGLPPPVVPTSILNGGFEAGTLTNWTSGGNEVGLSVAGGATYAHSDTYSARLAESGSLGYLSQTISTTPGVVYSISFWLDSPTTTTPSEFLLSWNGEVLMDKTNVAKTGWTNIQFLVTATETSAVLQFGFRHDASNFGLDDISVGPAQPAVAAISLSRTNLVLEGLGGLAGRTYYVLMGTNVTQPLDQWVPVATNVLGADGNFSITATNAVNPNARQRFYILRVP